jgi:hypothetical protein
MSKKQGHTDKTMQKWWRLAVLRANGNQCAVCGLIRPDHELECHHLIKRRFRILRHDYRNGVPVCIGDCHRKADANSGWLIQKHPYRDHITRITSSFVSVKDFLQEEGMSLDEYDAKTLEELKSIVKGGYMEAS